MMWFFWFPFLVALPVALVMLAHRGTPAGCCGVHDVRGEYPATPGQPQGADPVAIVRERLARGEITPEQYEAIRRALG